MWTLVITISLMTKFNHALDVESFPNHLSKDQCEMTGKKVTEDLKSFNKEVETKFFCYEKYEAVK